MSRGGDGQRQTIVFNGFPLEEDDDLIDRLMEHHPGFGKLLERRCVRA